ncbi:MAG: rhodanese-like domain-containing protein [Spirosomataceae bacterium]
MKSILSSFLLVFSLWSCGNTEENGVKGVDVATFKEVLQEKKEGILLDIRTDAEVATGKIPGAIQLDYYSSDFTSEISKLDTSKPLFLYCAVGGRSASAISDFQKAGFKEIYHLQPGIQGWKAAGETIE